MLGIIIAVVVIVGIMVVFALNRLAKLHIMRLFLTSFSMLKERGCSTEEALRASIDNFRYRAPFDVIDNEALQAMVEVLCEVHHPAEVGGIILQQCDQERGKSVRLSHSGEFAEWALQEDTTMMMQDILLDAQHTLTQMNEKLPNNDLLAAIAQMLCSRKGWTLIGRSSSNETVYKYVGKEVRFPSVTNVKDFMVTVLRSEFREASTSSSSGSMVQQAKARALTTNDTFFDDCFERLREPRMLDLA